MSSHVLDQTIYPYYQSIGYRQSTILKKIEQETFLLKNAKPLLSPEQGQLLHLLVKLLNPKRILEIGIFTGYSSTAMATALSDSGKLIACDCNEQHTAVAKQYWQQAGVADKIEFRLGMGMDIVNNLTAEKQLFDFIFIDANKKDYINYYHGCLNILVEGGCMIFDNMLRAGKAIASNVDDSSVTTQSIRALNQIIYEDPNIDFVLLPIGAGMSLIRKRDD